MFPALFAQAPTPDEVARLRHDVGELNDLAEALGLAFFLLLGHVLLFVGWATYRRWRPAAPGADRVPVSFVAWLFAGLVALPAAWWAVSRGWTALSPARQADVIVVAHVTFVLGVLVAQVAVLLGWAMGWSWVCNFWFRLAHLLGIHLVASQAALAIHCPLTSWEFKLRGSKAEWEALTQASDLGRWSHQVLFHTPGTILLVVYVAFTLAVLVTWLFVPPRWPWASAPAPAQSSHES
jgi:hypothetical protein